jgi:N-acetyl-anhydromuramoyl-L-alanine amidase
MALFSIQDGWLTGVTQHKSPHYSVRTEADGVLSLQVIHNISLPPGQFGGDYITDFFMGRLDITADPYFPQIAELNVSAHCLIKRDGELIQYVSFLDKAWHAGVSCYQGRAKCNDYAIGIELEGTDDLAYSQAQYQQLARLSASLIKHYPTLNTEQIVGHCDIAPERKTDPGDAFNWQYFQLALHNMLINPV